MIYKATSSIKNINRFQLVLLSSAIPFGSKPRVCRQEFQNSGSPHEVFLSALTTRVHAIIAIEAVPEV